VLDMFPYPRWHSLFVNTFGFSCVEVKLRRPFSLICMLRSLFI
jgi:hypothetical protein